MKTLFSKYQSQLLQFANHPFGQKFLGIDKQLCRILPNGYEWQIGRDLSRGKLYTSNKLANKLGLAITALDIAELKDVKSFLYYLGLAKRPFYTPIVNFTTLNASAGNGACSKNQYGGGSEWENTRNAAAAASVEASTMYLSCFFVADGPNGSIRRDFVPFDTSLLSGVTAASLYLYATTASYVDTATASMAVTQSTQASITALVVADYSAITLNSPPEGATRKAFSTFSQNAWNHLDLNATGLGWIGTALKLCLRTDKDVDNSQPTTGTNSTINFHSVAEANPPYLDYTLPSSSSGILSMEI